MTLELSEKNQRKIIAKISGLKEKIQSRIKGIDQLVETLSASCPPVKVRVAAYQVL